MKKKRGHKGRQHRQKKLNDMIAAVRQEEDIREEAAEYDMHLRVSVCKGRKLNFLHWRFVARNGKHVLHYWPSSMTWWCPVDGEKGTCKESREALELARFRLRRFRQETPEEWMSRVERQASNNLDSIGRGAY